jgi:transposase
VSCARSKNTYFGARYRRVASRRRPAKALVAVEHSILTAAWHMLTTGELYNDPGADYFTRQVPAKAKARAIGQLESLGYQVTLEPPG